ncbi:MAG: hypothetical protein M3R00_09450 [Pseudomonadota bacterium]|nr:hypothetical protein [Pseudomonadota bacterium]
MGCAGVIDYFDYRNRILRERNRNFNQALSIRLSLVSDSYFNSLSQMIKCIYDAFKKMFEYVKDTYDGFDPLELEVTDELKNILHQIE